MPALKYLFYAIHKDGSTVTQTPEDVSYQDPTKSAFFDVRSDEVERFGLRGTDAWYEVNLDEDTLTVNGTVLRLPAQEQGKLVYFRRNYVEMKEGGEHRIGYHLGIKYSDVAFSMELF
jgi:hypothetical protein